MKLRLRYSLGTVLKVFALGGAISIAIAWISAVNDNVWINQVGSLSSAEGRLRTDIAMGQTWGGSGWQISMFYWDDEASTTSDFEATLRWYPLDRAKRDFVDSAVAKKKLGDSEKRWIEARGWPLRCLWYEACRMRYTPSGTTSVVETGIQGAIVAPLKPRFVRDITGIRSRTIYESPPLLPYRPIWSGLVFNAIAFGIPAWLLMFGWRDMRSAQRVRRRCCPRCGYPFGSSEVCTECGLPLRLAS